MVFGKTELLGDIVDNGLGVYEVWEIENQQFN